MEPQTVNRAQAEEDVRILAERLALLYYYFVKTAEERYGIEEARALAQAAIAAYGAECGRLTRQNVEAQGLTNTLANQYLGGDLPSLGWQSEVLEADEAHKLVKTSYCPLADTWQRYGAEEWGRIYCEVDPAKFRGYNACLRCSADKSLLAGDDCCLLRVEYE